MGFIDSYKRLEQLCGDLLGDSRRVSAYIDEMERLPRGRIYVSSWETDLKQLKHYRWVRNKIVHEPGCTEENMCFPDDALWIEAFHARIISGSDPLAQYRKATSRPTSRPAQVPQPQQTSGGVYPPRSSFSGQKKHHSRAVLLKYILIFAAILFFFALRGLGRY